MDRGELKKELYKLAPTSYEGDFREHLSAQLQTYARVVKSFDNHNIVTDWNEIYEHIDRIIDSIKEAVKRIYQGQHSSAYSILRTRLNKIPQTYGIYMSIPTDSNLYRMRVFDNNTKDKPVRKEMFHIPFDKRGIVKTERYSAPGYPCLYLGMTSYICWEEMNRPNLNKCYVSKYNLRKDILALNLALPSDSLWENDMFLVGLLIRFPLIIASMVQVKNKDDVFKPEYIIPQLITEWIIEQINSGASDDKPIGVFYTSVHVKDGFNFPAYTFNNLALPAQSPFAGKYSRELCDRFLISEPTSDEIEHAKGTYNKAENILIAPKNQNESSMQAYNYNSSVFGLMEKQLKNNTKDYPADRLDYK